MHKRSFRSVLEKNKREIIVLLTVLAILIIFISAGPQVFLRPDIYFAIFTTVPIAIILTVSLVFVITSGELDLSFGSVMGLTAMIFAYATNLFNNPYIGFLLAIAGGLFIGMINGVLVTKVKLPSLVSTLGMMFLIRGFIMIVTQARFVPMTHLIGSTFHNIFTMRLGRFPMQMIWAIIFTAFLWFLFNKFRFGAHVKFTGDNKSSAKEMGINVNKTLVGTFCLVGIAAAFSGTFSVLINHQFISTIGDGYLLMVLAGLFLGGTPTWGGVGTIIGAFLGALILGFFHSGIIAAGLTAYWTQFFYGLIIILAVTGHRFNVRKGA
jgi:ribose/xylose/arabinose/galactoside ABC-type transport system permease subunit